MKPVQRTPSTPTRRRRSDVPVSPAARELTTRALYKSPRKSVSKKLPVVSEGNSDESSDSIMSEKALLVALDRKSWKKNLRSSDFHQPLEQSGASDDSLVEINKRKGATKKSSSKSSEEMQLPPYSPQKDEENEQAVVEKPETPVKARPRRKRQQDDDGERIQAELNKSLHNAESPQGTREPPKSSLLAFKKSGMVRHSDSEESEPDVRRRPPARKSSRNVQNDTRFSNIFKDMTIDSNNAEETTSEVDSPIQTKRKKPKKSVKSSEPSMYLDLKLDQTRVVQHSDDTSDSEIIAMIRKRVKPKKSHSKPTKISLPMEDEIENSPVHAEIDSDTGGDVVPQRKRARMSKRKTINQLEINLSDISPEEIATPSNDDDDEDDDSAVTRRKKKRTKTVSNTANPSVELDILPTPEKAVIEPEEPEEEIPTSRPSRGRQATKKTIEPYLELPVMTPERRSAPNEPESEEDEIPTRNQSKRKEKMPLAEPDFIMTPEKKSLPEESSDTDEALPPQRKLRSSSKNRDQSDEFPYVDITPERVSIPVGHNSEDSPMGNLKRAKSSTKTVYDEEDMELSLENASADAEVDQPRRAARSFHNVPSPSSFRGPTPKIPLSPAWSVASGVNSTTKSHLASSRHQDLNMTPLAQPDMEMSLEKSSRKDVSRLVQSASKPNKAAAVQTSELDTHSRVSDQDSDLSDNDSLPDTRRKRVESKSTESVSDFPLSPYAGSNRSSGLRQSTKLKQSSKSVEDAEPGEMERRQKRTKSSNSTKSSLNLSPPSARDSVQAASEESNLNEVSAMRRSTKAPRTTKSTSDMDISSLGNTMNVSKSKSNVADDSDEEEDPSKFSRKPKKSRKQSEAVLLVLEKSPAKSMRSSSTAKDQDSDSEDEIVINRRVKSKKKSSMAFDDFNLSLPLSTPTKSVNNDDDVDNEVPLQRESSKNRSSRSSMKVGPHSSHEQLNQVQLAGNDKNKEIRGSNKRSAVLEPAMSTSANNKSDPSSSINGSKSTSNIEEKNPKRSSRKSNRSTKLTEAVWSDVEESSARNLRRSSTAKDQDSDSEDEPLISRRVKSKKKSTMAVEELNISLPLSTPTKSGEIDDDADDEVPLQRNSRKSSKPTDSQDQMELSSNDKNEETRSSNKSTVDLELTKGLEKSGRSSSKSGLKSTRKEEEVDLSKEANRKSSKPDEDRRATSLRSSSAANDQDSDSEAEPDIKRRVKPKKSSLVEEINISLPPTTPTSSVRNDNDEDEVPLQRNSRKSSKPIDSHDQQDHMELSGNDKNEETRPGKKSTANLEPTMGVKKSGRSSSTSGPKSSSNEEEVDLSKEANRKSRSRILTKPDEERRAKSSRSSSAAKDQDSDSESEPDINRRVKSKKSSFVEEINLSLPPTTPATRVGNDDEDEVPLQRDSRKDRFTNSSMSIANTQSFQELPEQSSSNKMLAGKVQNRDSKKVSSRSKESRSDLELTKSTTATDKISIGSNSKSSDEEEDPSKLNRNAKKSRKQSEVVLPDLENSPEKSVRSSATANDQDSDPEVDIVRNRRAKPKKSSTTSVVDLNFTGLTTPAKSVRSNDFSDYDDVPISRDMKNYSPSKSRDLQSSQEQPGQISFSSRQEKVNQLENRKQKESSVHLEPTSKAHVEKQSARKTIRAEESKIRLSKKSSSVIPRKSKGLLEIEEILNSKKSVSAIKSKEYKVLHLSRSVDHSKVSDSIHDEASNVSKDSLPDLQRKVRTQTSTSSNETFNLQLEMTTETTVDDVTRNDTRLRTKSAVSSTRALLLDTENAALKKSKSWAANANTPSVAEVASAENVKIAADAKFSQGSARSSQTTHVSESPDRETQDTIDLPEIDIESDHRNDTRENADENNDVEAEKSSKISNSTVVEKDASNTTVSKPGMGEEGSAEASTVGLPIVSDVSEDEAPDLNRKQKARAGSTLEEDAVGDLNFDETSLDASNQSAADPSQSQDAAVIHTEQQPIDEHQNSTIIDQEQASDYDSEASDDETSANFKRRKIQPKKSSVISMSAISNLQFSIPKSDKDKSRKSSVVESGDAEKAGKPPKVSKAGKSEKAKSSLNPLPLNAAVDITAESEGISFTHNLDDDLARFSTFKHGTTSDNILDILAGGKTSKQSTRNESQLASTENKIVETSKRSDNFRVPPPHKKSSLAPKISKLSLASKRVSFVDEGRDVVQPTRESIKRNLQVSLEVAVSSDVANESSIQAEEHLDRGMTSTPINDITMSLKEGKKAIMFLENNLDIVNESPDEERIYQTSDFQAALDTEGSKLLLPFTKSKKIFSLVEFGQAMQAVRSPSMIATSMRLSTDHSKLFSIRDFERAVVKLRNVNNRKSSTALSTLDVVQPEEDEGTPYSAVSEDEAAGGSFDGESEKGSSQEKANDELHTTTETTEHSQDLESPEKELEEVENETVVDYDATDVDPTVEYRFEEDVEETIVEYEESGGMEEQHETIDEEAQPESSQEQAEKTIDQPASSQELEDETIDQPASSQELEEETIDPPASSQELEEKTFDQPASSQELEDETIDQPASSPSKDSSLDKDNSLTAPEDRESTVEENAIVEEEDVLIPNQMGNGTFDVSQKESRGSSSSRALLAQKKSRQAHEANKSSAGKTLITSYFNPAAGSSSQTTAKRSLLHDSSPQPKRSLDMSGVNPMRPTNAMQDFLKNWGTFTAEMVAKKEAKDAADAIKAQQKERKMKAELKATAALAKKPRAAVKRKPLPNVNIFREIKQPWVNKRLVNRVQKHFKDEPPKVMNDFLRTLAANVQKVLVSKSVVPDAAVRRVMKILHKTEICKSEHEFFMFANSYLPSSFQRIAFMERNFKEEYYEFK